MRPFQLKHGTEQLWIITAVTLVKPADLGRFARGNSVGLRPVAARSRVPALTSPKGRSNIACRSARGPFAGLVFQPNNLKLACDALELEVRWASFHLSPHISRGCAVGVRGHQPRDGRCGRSAVSRILFAARSTHVCAEASMCFARLCRRHCFHRTEGWSVLGLDLERRNGVRRSHRSHRSH